MNTSMQMNTQNVNSPSAAPAAKSIIEVSNLRRDFQSMKKEEGLKNSIRALFKPEVVIHEAVKGVSFSIEEGSFVGLIGANGAGKTTLLKILSGLIPPTSGNANVLGFTPFDREIEFRKSIALVMGQKAQLWWDLSALDAFELIRAIYGIPERLYRDRLKMFTDLLQVEKQLNTQIRRLSLGERMKMELIGAILHWPKVIFLDEPTIGLDVLAAQKLREFLSVFNKQEKATIILTSHNMDDIERCCTRVMIMKQGEMIFDGSAQGLTKKEENTLIVRLLETPSIEDLSRLTSLAAGKITSEEESHFSLQIKQSEIPAILTNIMSAYKVLELKIEEQSLESVIQRLYEGKSS